MPFVLDAARRAASSRESTRSRRSSTPSRSCSARSWIERRAPSSSEAKALVIDLLLDVRRSSSASSGRRPRSRELPRCTAPRRIRPIPRGSRRPTTRSRTTTARAASDYRSANVVLVGVSRTGKTPTCLYLALQYGVLRRELPADRGGARGRAAAESCCCPIEAKLYGLTSRKPERLQQIRSERRPGSRYASRAASAVRAARRPSAVRPARRAVPRRDRVQHRGDREPDHGRDGARAARAQLRIPGMDVSPRSWVPCATARRAPRAWAAPLTEVPAIPPRAPRAGRSAGPFSC